MESGFFPKVHQQFQWRQCAMATSIAISDLILRADALKLKSCAESCDAGMASLDDCLPYVLPFVLHHVTLKPWPVAKERYALKDPQFWPPRSWGGPIGRSCPFGGCWRERWPAGVLTRVSRSMFAAVKQYAKSEKLTRNKPLTYSEDAAIKRQ